MRRLFLLAAAGALACGPPVPAPPVDGGADARVSFEPESVASQVPSVVHIHLSGSVAGALSLFEGKLSSYYLGLLKQSSVPEALAARQIPSVSWLTDSVRVVAPLRPLVTGQYSLAGAAGLIAEFQVSASAPLLARLWPPEKSGGSPQFAVYCNQDSVNPAPPSGELRFEPGGMTVSLEPGVDDEGAFADRCAHFSTATELDSGTLWVPPPTVGAWALDPSPFSAGGREPATPLSCTDGESLLGLGCALAADDRLTVRTPDADLLWIVHTARGTLVEVTHPSAVLVVPGLSPGSRQRVWGSVRDLTGASFAIDWEMETAAARPRPVLNEALADALGPEPQSEWLELFNDGTLGLDLSGYFLQDGGGRTALPNAYLPPKTYALLVRDDFAPNGSDEPPLPGTLLIHLPTLGKSGLSNSGERLALIDRSGSECSVLPAMVGKPGQSLARLSPASSDDDPRAFSVGAPTPGAPNSLRAPTLR